MFRVLEMSRIFRTGTDCFIDTMTCLEYFKNGISAVVDEAVHLLSILSDNVAFFNNVIRFYKG